MTVQTSCDLLMLSCWSLELVGQGEYQPHSVVWADTVTQAVVNLCLQAFMCADLTCAIEIQFVHVKM